jgi:putative transposase
VPTSTEKRSPLQPLPWPFRFGTLTRSTLSPARAFFVTSSIARTRKLLRSDRSAGLFVRVLYDYLAQRKFRIHEFVVIPDHFHALLTVESDSTMERSVQFIKGGFAFLLLGRGGSLG